MAWVRLENTLDEIEMKDVSKLLVFAGNHIFVYQDDGFQWNDDDLEYDLIDLYVVIHRRSGLFIGKYQDREKAIGLANHLEQSSGLDWKAIGSYSHLFSRNLISHDDNIRSQILSAMDEFLNAFEATS